MLGIHWAFRVQRLDSLLYNLCKTFNHDDIEYRLFPVSDFSFYNIDFVC